MSSNEEGVRSMDDCIFCKVARGEVKSWKVYEDENTYAFFDINPATEYHTLIIPKAHYENIFDTPEEVLFKIMSTVKKVATLYETKLGIRNVQIRNSSGVEAQQDVFHIHFHVVPRKYGDNQDTKWLSHPEWRAKFDELLIKLR
ncbi:HIT family protein [Alicyclobacillus fodiniaquatilis]|uniref:HIT family protein n=1 Tax=Alicyclobacillus fodiniaquatilis TaxID=1661150 RepID=A0ABW4JF21_9BACL